MILSFQNWQFPLYFYYSIVSSLFVHLPRPKNSPVLLRVSMGRWLLRLRVKICHLLRLSCLWAGTAVFKMAASTVKFMITHKQSCCYSYAIYYLFFHHSENYISCWIILHWLNILFHLVNDLTRKLFWSHTISRSTDPTD